MARRASAAEVAQRRSRLFQQAKKKGRRVSAAQLTLCAWTVYRTNLPADLLRWQEAWVLAWARWPIELLFKLWKSHGGREASRGERAKRVLCAGYAQLIGPVVQQWLLVTCVGPGVAYSYPNAVRRVRRLALVLALLLPVAVAVVRIRERLRQRMQKRCRAQKRRGRPSTQERLLDPDRVSARDEQQQTEETESQAA